MECRILGPLEATIAGRPLEVSGERRRGLLAFLVVNAGAVVTMEEIVNAVWPDEAALGKYGTVRTYVSQLRKALTGGGAVIATAGGGYRLEIARAAVDATRFEDLSREAYATVDLIRRHDLFEEARACWRGRALAEFRHLEWADRAARALETKRLEVLEQGIDTTLAMGLSGDLLPELEMLVREHPLSERFWGQRMIALYRCGRQGEALRTCAELRKLLAEELGIEPSSDIATLELRILDHDPTLLVPPRSGSGGPAAAQGIDLPTGTVTFLMTDIVGSTELWDEKPSAMSGAVLAHEAIIDDAVTRAGGHRLKRRGEGDSTLSVFERAVDALDAALNIKRAFALETGDLALAVRIALHTGEVEERDGDYFGPTLNRTARLRALASGNEILCSRTTADLVADSLPSSVSVIELGAMQLRGLRRSELVYQVADTADLDDSGARGLAATQGSTPNPLLPDDDRLPSRLVASTMNAPSMVGREREWRIVRQSFERARRGTRQVVFVTGEPGIGKTRLAAEAASLALRDGAGVLYGRCDEGLGVPYQPFVEALRSDVEACPGRDLRARLGRYPGELVRLLPELTERVGGLSTPLRSDPATEQYRLFEAVADWLDAASAKRPLVFVLDDLHWAADPTLLLLRHVLCSQHPAPTLIIATYRESELGRSNRLVQLVADLRTDVPSECMEHVELAGLDQTGVGAFVTAIENPGDATSAQFVQMLHAQTGGNPFFINEVLRSRAEGGVSDPLREARIPPAAREVVLRRVARLSENAQRALQIAAVLGTEFDVAVLEAMVGLLDDELLSALEEASAARLVDECGIERFSFAHALVRTALYEGLTESRRLRLHRRAGEAIESVHAQALGAHLSELAFHFSSADPGKAVRYAIEAADAALQSLAFEDALNVCERALVALTRAREANVVVPVIDECDLLLRLGRAEIGSGRAGALRTLLRSYELARDLADHRRMAEAVLSANRGFFSQMGRVDRELVGALEDAIACQPTGSSAVLAELLAALASELEWADDGERRFALADEALAIARDVGDTRTLARVLLLRPFTIVTPDTLEERLVNCDELLRIANEVGDPAIMFRAAWSRSSTMAESGDFGAAGEMEALATTLAEELHQPTLRWQASSMRASRLILDAELDEAERLAGETLDLGRLAHQETDAFLFYNEQMLEIRRWQDRLAEPMTELRDFAGSPETDFAFALTRYLFDAEERELARACYERIQRDLQLPPRRDLLAGATLCNLAYLAVRFADAQRAKDLYEALGPFESAFAQTTVVKPVGSHFLGMLAASLNDDAAADLHFERALITHDRANAPLLAAETRLEWARALRARQPARSDELLQAARAAASANGAAFIERGCDELAATLTD